MASGCIQLHHLAHSSESTIALSVCSVRLGIPKRPSPAPNRRKALIIMHYQRKERPDLMVTKVAKTRAAVALTRAWSSQKIGGGGGWHKALVVGSVSLWRRLLASRLWTFCYDKQASVLLRASALPHLPGWESRMQFLPMASSPDGLISARYAVITKGGGGVQSAHLPHGVIFDDIPDR